MDRFGVFRLLRPLALVLLALPLVLLPCAAAQTQVTVGLAIKDLPTARVSTNDTVYVEKFTVELNLKNVVCPQGADLPLTVTATTGSVAASGNGSKNSTSAIVTEFTPAHPAFHVDAGQYVATAYTKTLDLTLSVRPASIPYSGLDVPVTVGATLGAATGAAACQGQGTIGGTAQATPYTIHFARGTEPAPIVKSPEMPAPGLALLLVALAAAVGLIRRWA